MAKKTEKQKKEQQAKGCVLLILIALFAWWWMSRDGGDDPARPTGEERALYDEWFEVAGELLSGGEIISSHEQEVLETTAFRLVARKHAFVDEEDLRDIVFKCNSWDARE